MLAALDGAEIPGGCPHCDAIQKIRIVEENVTHITIMHDEWCPILKKIEGRT